MKKKNGFTLIELLAIIVILAIIAVITVPIILNIIENSRKGAVTDSAYGYKDAVNKWYVSKLQDDNNYRLDGDYNIINGKLDNIEIPLSGDKPTNGTLTYSNNVLTGGCLTIGEYKVTFDSKGSVSKTEKGECEVIPTIPSCPGCVFAYIEENMQYGTNGTILDENEYVKDYTNLNKNYFLGLKLDKNSKIEKAYVCGIITKETEKIPFCIEGTTDGTSNEKNIELLTEILGEYNDETMMGCSIYEGDCSCEATGVSLSSDKYGQVNVQHYEENKQCYVTPQEELGCKTTGR